MNNAIVTWRDKNGSLYAAPTALIWVYPPERGGLRLWELGISRVVNDEPLADDEAFELVETFIKETK